MEYTGSPRCYQVLTRLRALPRKMMALHGTDYSNEFVIHELCHHGCLNLTRAAYFVDNPDFDCLQGVAGYDHTEHESGDLLDNEALLKRHLPSCRFNQKVRGMSKRSSVRSQQSQRTIIEELARELSMKNPCCYVWQLKHGNHGILLYEADCPLIEELLDCLQDGVHLLGFCPLSRWGA